MLSIPDCAAGMSRRAAGAVIVIAAALVLIPAASPSVAASECRVLPVSKSLKRTLLRVHIDFTRGRYRQVVGPLGRVYYGRCGQTRYAFASFSHKTAETDFGVMDQPARFRRPAGGRWRDLGDTGGDVCHGVPAALVKLWGLYGRSSCALNRSRAATAASRACKPIPARPRASYVRAVNMSCAKARWLVREQTYSHRMPAGWVWINPAGCEGFIVRRRDQGYVLSHGYRLPTGAPAVRAVIYRGCAS